MAASRHKGTLHRCEGSEPWVRYSAALRGHELSLWPRGGGEAAAPEGEAPAHAFSVENAAVTSPEVTSRAAPRRFCIDVQLAGGAVEKFSVEAGKEELEKMRSLSSTPPFF